MTAANRFAPNLAALEARDCPASVVIANHTLSITTDVESESVNIRDDGQGNVTTYVSGPDGRQTFRARGITAIRLHSRGDHDRIDYRLTGQLKTSQSLLIDVGKGERDRMNLDFSKGTNGGNLRVDLRGRIANGRIDTTIGHVRNSQVNIYQRLADGTANSHVNLIGDLHGRAGIYVG